MIRRRELSPQRPYAVVAEQEPCGGGRSASTLTIFLTASECPIGCQMCDLWQNTLTSATPIGAIPVQIDWALESHRPADWVKLYNSGNFFDRRSVPVSDYTAIADRCAAFSRVVVENHPKIGPDSMSRFRDLIAGQLEVAVGLETVQPRMLKRLQKRMTRDDFDRYAARLDRLGIDLRVFLIVGAPGISVSEAIRWARLSLRHSLAAGARHVSLIPARFGQGWNGRGRELTTLSLDDLAEVQSACLDDADARAIVTVDLWDRPVVDPIEEAKRRRLARVNLSQQADSS